MNYIKYGTCQCGMKASNIHIYNCSMLNKNKVHYINYHNLFNGTVHEQKEIVKILNENHEKHEKWSEALGTLT